MEATNRFKRLDLIEYLKNYGQRFVTLYRRRYPKPPPRKRNARRQSGTLRRPNRGEKRKEAKDKGERDRCTQLNAYFLRITRRNKKAFLSEQAKK